VVIFRKSAKSGSGQISKWICQIQVHLQYVQLITDKTNAADLLCGVFAILLSVTRMKKYKIHCSSTNFAKNWQNVTLQS